VTTFFAPSRRLIVCNAGHPRPFLYRASQKKWELLGDEGLGSQAGPSNIPLGILAVSEYGQFDVELESGDCLLSYTDALIEACDADGEMLGEDGLLRILRLLGDVEPDKMIETLLEEIAGRHPGNLSDDDVTALLVRANGRKPSYTFGEQLAAAGRFFRALMTPWAERPPFPDLSLANIGGAIIPALGRRWRAVRRSR
jgi:hypothetical protein